MGESKGDDSGVDGLSYCGHNKPPGPLSGKETQVHHTCPLLTIAKDHRERRTKVCRRTLVTREAKSPS